MPITTLTGHFDGNQICIDEPYKIQPNTKLIITILPKNEFDLIENESWYNLSYSGLNAGYGNEEPEYSNELLREVNLDYEGR
jgi:hypothetical protein